MSFLEHNRGTAFKQLHTIPISSEVVYNVYAHSTYQTGTYQIRTTNLNWHIDN